MNEPKDVAGSEKQSRWTLRPVPANYFLRSSGVVWGAACLALIVGFLAPKDDWAEVAAICTGPLVVLLLGSRMKWYAVALFAAVHLATLVLARLSQEALRFGVVYAFHGVDYDMIGIVSGVCILGSEVIWILLRMIRGAPVVVEPTCSSCSYNLTSNVSGVCPECGTNVSTLSRWYRDGQSGLARKVLPAGDGGNR